MLIFNFFLYKIVFKVYTNFQITIVELITALISYLFYLKFINKN